MLTLFCLLPGQNGLEVGETRQGGQSAADTASGRGTVAACCQGRRWANPRATTEAALTGLSDCSDKGKKGCPG